MTLAASRFERSRAGRRVWGWPFFFAAVLVLPTILVAYGSYDPLMRGVKLYSNDFEAEALHALPAGWYALSGNWQIFRDTTNVMRQVNPQPRRTCYSVVAWLNYTVQVRACALRTSSTWGMGVVAYWRDKRHHYRLMNYGDELHLVKVVDGVPISLSRVPFLFELERWYWFKLRVDNVPDRDRVIFWGRVWLDGEEEPKEWLLFGEDIDLQPTVRQGWAGLWAAKAVCDFDDFTVTMPAAGEESNSKQLPIRYADNFERAEVGKSPTDWVTPRGDWIIVQSGSKVLRHTHRQSPLEFEHNSYAVVQGWRDYAVSARMRCTEGGEDWGMGLVGYWQDESRYYRLSNRANLLILEANPGEEETRGLGQQEMHFAKGQWYNFQLEVRTELTATRIVAKVWPVDTQEPFQPTFAVTDDSPNRLRWGTIGLVAVQAACNFDDVLVRELPTDR